MRDVTRKNPQNMKEKKDNLPKNYSNWNYLLDPRYLLGFGFFFSFSSATLVGPAEDLDLILIYAIWVRSWHKRLNIGVGLSSQMSALVI